MDLVQKKQNDELVTDALSDEFGFLVWGFHRL